MEPFFFFFFYSIALRFRIMDTWGYGRLSRGGTVAKHTSLLVHTISALTLADISTVNLLRALRKRFDFTVFVKKDYTTTKRRIRLCVLLWPYFTLSHDLWSLPTALQCHSASTDSFLIWPMFRLHLDATENPNVLFCVEPVRQTCSFIF